MTRPAEILSEIVAEIRDRRAHGDAASKIARELMSRGLSDSELRNHIDAAFDISTINPGYVPRGADGHLDAAFYDQMVEALIEATGGAWQRAAPYPDLYRRRDRYAFRQIARESRCLFVVKAAEPAAAPHVGRPGFKPFALHQAGVCLRTGPNRGLMAGDPSDAALQVTLEKANLELSPGSSDFIIQARDGTRFYPAYELMGVYRMPGGLSAWTSLDAEGLRHSLNLHMGEELVAFGPHDDWDFRFFLGAGDPRRGPLLPAIIFMPDGNASVCFDAESLSRQYRFVGINWDARYPPQSDSRTTQESA